MFSICIINPYRSDFKSMMNVFIPTLVLVLVLIMIFFFFFCWVCYLEFEEHVFFFFLIC